MERVDGRVEREGGEVAAEEDGEAVAAEVGEESGKVWDCLRYVTLHCLCYMTEYTIRCTTSTSLVGRWAE